MTCFSVGSGTFVLGSVGMGRVGSVSTSRAPDPNDELEFTISCQNSSDMDGGGFLFGIY